MQPHQEETTIIIKNPDGTIQLATQPHLKNKRIMECWKCKGKLIYNVKSKLVQCCYCSSLNGVVNSAEDIEMERGDELTQLIAKKAKSYKDLKRILYLIRKNNLRMPDVEFESGIDLITAFRSRLGTEYYIILEQIFRSGIDVKQFDTAKKCLITLRKKFPDAPRIIKLSAVWNQAIGETQAAEQMVDSILSANPLDLDACKLRIAISRAPSDSSQSIQGLNNFLIENMCDKEAWLELADIYLDTLNYQQALYCYEELIVLAPREFPYFLKCAEILYTIGSLPNLKIARSYYSHYINNDSSSLTALFGLVQTCRAIEVAKKGEKKNKELLDLGLEKIKKLYSKATTGALVNFFPFAKFPSKN